MAPFNKSLSDWNVSNHEIFDLPSFKSNKSSGFLPNLNKFLFFSWALCTVHRDEEPRILKYFKRNSEKLKTFRNQNISLEIWYKFCSKTSKHDEFCCIILVSAIFYFSWLQIFSVPKRKARTCWRYTAFEIKTAAHRFCVYF